MILLNKAKNYIINGGMDFFQRGTTFTNPVNATFIADRFKIDKAGTMTFNTARDIDVPTQVQANYLFPYSLSLTVGTAQPVMLAASYTQLSNKIEGQIFAPLIGKRCILSFWVKSSLVGTYAVSFRNNLADRSYVSTYDVLVANTWEKKTVTVIHDPTGVWNYTTGTGLTVSLHFGAGTDSNVPTKDTWVNGSYISHSSVVNFVATAGNVIKFTGVQLEEGIEASNFERAGGNVINELMLCQRYFEKSYDPEAPIGTITPTGRTFFRATATTGPQNLGTIQYIQAKRTIPTVFIYSPVTGAVGNVRDVTASLDISSGPFEVGTKAFTVSINISITKENGATLHYAADAEL